MSEDVSVKMLNTGYSVQTNFIFSQLLLQFWVLGFGSLSLTGSTLASVFSLRVIHCSTPSGLLSSSLLLVRGTEPLHGGTSQL